MEALEDGEDSIDMQDEDGEYLTTSGYNQAYDDITNNHSTIQTGPYFALQSDNVTSQSRADQQGGNTQSRALQQSPGNDQIFYDPNTSEEEELQEILRFQGDSDSAFTEEQDEASKETSEDMSRSTESSEPDSDDLRGEGRRGPRPRGRSSRSTAGRGPRQRGWKWALKGTEHDPARNRPARARGQRQGRRGGRRGPQPVRPNAEFQQVMSLANQAYLASNLEDALDLAKEAILLNPEIQAAHSLLSQVLDEMGRQEDALGALLAGAHASRDIRVWYNVVERTIERGGDDKNAVFNQLLYCYSNILSIDQKEYKARLDRAKIYLDLGRDGRVRSECEMILRYRPYELEVIRLLAKLSSTLEEAGRTRRLFDDAFQLQMEGKGKDRTRMDWPDLRSYLDLLCQDGQYTKACSRLSQIARWILGRGADQTWDETAEDDREWDVEDQLRRTQTPGFDSNRYHNRTYGAGLPLDIRVKLGIIRLNIGPQYHVEAMSHFKHLEPMNRSLNAPIITHESLFVDVAKSLKSSLRFKEAIQYYEVLIQMRRRQDWEAYSALAICYRNIGSHAKSRQSLRAFISVNEEHIDARVTLGKWCEEDGKVDEASQLVAEVIRLSRMEILRRAKLRSLRAVKRRHPHIMDTPSVPLTAAAIEANELASLAAVDSRTSAIDATERALVVGGYKTKPQSYNDDIQELHERMKTLQDSGALEEPNALEEWLAIAEVMTEDFKTMKSFYLDYSRFKEDQDLATPSAISEMKALASRILSKSGGKKSLAIDPSEVLPDDYCGISWDAWLDVFCQYAIQLAKMQETEACYASLMAVVESLVFQKNDHYMKSVHVCWLACGLILDDEQTVCNVCRWFIKRYPYTNEANSLFGVANSLLRSEPNWYNSGPSQKFVLRQLKGMDYALLDPESRDRYNFTETEKRSYGGTEANINPYGLTELDPPLLMLYGHILAVSGSFANALNYYFRAYTARPDHPMILLCIATNYIQLSMKRQSDNRQIHIQQGLSFLSRYYDIQTAGNVAIRVQEAEFNTAKVWHLLGLNHLAVPGYQKCLALSKRVQEEGDENAETEDFSREAAFALQNIFAVSGQQAAASEITEKWLVL